MYSFMPELDNALSSKGSAESLHPFKVQQALFVKHG